MTPQDHIESLQHAMLVRSGLMSADSPALHPAAREHINSSGHLLEQLAEFCSGMAANARPTGAMGRVSGLGTDDFKNTLGSVLRTAAQRQLESGQDYMALVREVPIVNFLPQKIVSGRIDAELQEANELGEYGEADAYDGIQQNAQLRSFGRNVFLSRKALVNDDISLIASSFGDFGGSAARLESRLVFDLLNSNTVFADGEPMFHVDHGNLIEHADGFSEALLAQAMDALRNLDFDGAGAGEAQNAAPAVLAVASGLELAARKLVYEAGLDFQVTAHPRITADTWYLMPSPKITPVIGLLRLAGSKTPLNIAPAKDRKVRDGVLYAVRCDSGVVPLSRYVVKGAKV